MLSPEESLAQARAQTSSNRPEAMRLYKELLQRVPGHPEASLELGQLLETCLAPNEALQIYQKAYLYHPEHPELFFKWQSLTLQQQIEHQLLQSPAEIMRSLIEHAQRFPAAIPALAQQASALFEHHNDIEEAQACLQFAAAACTGVDSFLLSLRAAVLSCLVPPNQQAIWAYAEALEAALLHHEEWAHKLFGEQKLSPEHTGHFMDSALYLSRLGYFNLPLLPLRAIMGRIMQAVLPDLDVIEAEHEDLCIGLLINSNSAVKALILPQLKYFPFEDAELHLFYVDPPNLQHHMQEILPQAHHHVLPVEFWSAVKAVQIAQMDLLYFTEIYTDRCFQLFCANYRLAPIQLSSWLSSGTTALPHVDLFLTHSLLESERPENHYSETLYFLPELPGMVERPLLPLMPERKDYGLPESGALYVCPHMLLKFHPDFDSALLAILRRDPTGHLVIQQRPPHLLSAFLQRIEAQAPELMPRIWVLPSMERNDYLGLLCLADVLLDPFYFGGGTTAFESLGLGLPVVNWPVDAMHGRFSAAFYRYIGVEDTIARDPEHYVTLAVGLAKAPDRNQALRSRIFDNAAVLFDQAESGKSFWAELLRIARTTRDAAEKESHE